MNFQIGENQIYAELHVSGNDTPQPLVLFAHGWNSSTLSASNYVEALNQQGFAVAAADLRAHGNTKGNQHKLVNKDWFNDLLEVYDFFANHKDVDPENIVVVGSSWGGYLTACLTAQRNPKGVVLRVPANYSDQEWNIVRNSVLTNPDELEHSKAVKAIKDYKGKVLIVESGDDEVIPTWMVEQYRFSGHTQTEYKVMKGAPHALGIDKTLHAQYLGYLVPWLKSVWT